MSAKRARRDEVASDVVEQLRDAGPRPGASLTLQLSIGLLAGLADDLRWRMSTRQPAWWFAEMLLILMLFGSVGAAGGLWMAPRFGWDLYPAALAGFVAAGAAAAWFFELPSRPGRRRGVTHAHRARALWMAGVAAGGMLLLHSAGWMLNVLNPLEYGDGAVAFLPNIDSARDVMITRHALMIALDVLLVVMVSGLVSGLRAAPTAWGVVAVAATSVVALLFIVSHAISMQLIPLAGEWVTLAGVVDGREPVLGAAEDLRFAAQHLHMTAQSLFALAALATGIALLRRDAVPFYVSALTAAVGIAYLPIFHGDLFIVPVIGTAWMLTLAVVLLRAAGPIDLRTLAGRPA
jgi:hypothetical protein